MIKFATYRYTDETMFHREAFSMLIPEGWSFTGGIYWRQHATMPGYLQASVKSPDGLYELLFLPSMPYYWGNNVFNFMAPAQGTYYMGNEMRPPSQDFLSYLQQYVLPKFGCRTVVTGSRKMPELREALLRENTAAFGCSVQADAGAADLSMEHGGLLYEGTLTCGIAVTTMMYNQVSWIADKMIATRMPAGQKQHCAPMFSTMLNSFRFDLNWYNQYFQYVQMQTQYVMQGIYQAGVTSRIIADTYNQISDTVRRSYENQQATYARTNQAFSEGLRGVNSYRDPYKGYDVELPDGYRYAYANVLGEYIVTNDASYNPNIGSNVNWTNINR